MGYEPLKSQSDIRSSYDACDPFVIITPRFYNIIASSPDRIHTKIRRMRSVCNHHSKILQHHRIITGSRKRTHTIARTNTRRMRSVCNHHSKILQHHRIITGTNAHTHKRTNTGRCARCILCFSGQDIIHIIRSSHSCFRG